MESDIQQYYDRGEEAGRLSRGAGRLEQARTRELLQRYLPPPPAIIYDVGGGSGVYALWLAGLGYEVHLLDAMPLHVEQARQASQAQPQHLLASAQTGDARRLPWPAASADAVLLLGPLYHLTEREDRLAAWREAARVLRPGAVTLAAAIARPASTFSGLFLGAWDDPTFVEIMRQDLANGQHRNPTDRSGYFTTAYFHEPSELKEEIEAAGLQPVATLGVEGPACWLLDIEARWAHPARREQMLTAARWLEAEPSLLGASAHLLAVARRPGTLAVRARLRLSIEDEPSAADLATVGAGLRSFNDSVVPHETSRPLNVLLRSDDGVLAGGLLGYLHWDWLYVKTLWVAEAVRGQGHGARLLALAEAEAERRGARRAHLDTLSFQALPFYQKYGYHVWGQLDDFPPGHTHYYLRKDFSPPGEGGRRRDESS
jgi:ubiquinone/menaquinone biosynthesis C-methylase UbiE/ribosomal protein S18 acetylase RimI-like enzyme